MASKEKKATNQPDLSAAGLLTALANQSKQSLNPKEPEISPLRTTGKRGRYGSQPNTADEFDQFAIELENGGRTGGGLKKAKKPQPTAADAVLDSPQTPQANPPARPNTRTTARQTQPDVTFHDHRSTAPSSSQSRPIPESAAVLFTDHTLKPTPPSAAPSNGKALRSTGEPINKAVTIPPAHALNTPTIAPSQRAQYTSQKPKTQVTESKVVPNIAVQDKEEEKFDDPSLRCDPVHGLLQLLTNYQQKIHADAAELQKVRDDMPDEARTAFRSIFDNQRMGALVTLLFSTAQLFQNGACKQNDVQEVLTLVELMSPKLKEHSYYKGLKQLIDIQKRSFLALQ